VDLLARIQVARGRAGQAIAELEQGLAAGALPVSGQVLLARLQLAAGRTERARSLYEQVLAAGDESPVVQNDLAWLLADAGAELERAQQLASAASAAQPGNPDFVDTLGYVYLRRGLHEPALEQFRRALELAGRGGEERPVLHHHLGLALRGLGRPAEAAAAFERALALDAAFPEAEQARRELEAARGAAGAPPG
jgi:tetratricopeptide (TPR) repeat protein